MNKREVLLALLQLEQYDTIRFIRKSRNRVDPSILIRLRRTWRFRLTKVLSYVTGIVLANIILGTVIALVEEITYLWVYVRVKQLKKLGLKVIVIAGSYGKTSVKKYAYDLLRHKYTTIATPESYNTVFGIAKTLKYEVYEDTQIFLVEIGAYHVGDIWRLTTMLSPDLGVITGITSQHLERFGSFANIIKAKSEIAVKMLQIGGPVVANGSDKHVLQSMKKIGGNITFYEGNSRKEVNINGAIMIAKLMGMSDKEIQKIVPKLKEPKNRFETTTDRYGMRVIDDSYSSNEKGFMDALQFLKTQKKYYRIVVTPGIVELGEETSKIHKELGRAMIGACDLVLLVNRNERTLAISEGTANKVALSYLDKTMDFVSYVKQLKLNKEPLILIENDVTENYN